MLVIFSIISTFEVLIQSPPNYEINPLRTDCYQSFSDPVIYINISHYNPTGPLYLYSDFNYSRYSDLPDNEIENIVFEYAFKRYDGQCENSVIFTTMGSNFKKIFIRIYLRLFKNQDSIAIFEYIFYKGFISDIYGLQDLNQNFILYTKILDSVEKNMGISINLSDNAKSYLKSIKGKRGHLCIITRNNHAAVVKFDYGLKEPTGLITILQAVIFKDEIYLGERNYSAFECQTYKGYKDKPIIFITDGNDYFIKFRIFYLKYSKGESSFVSKKYKLSNPKFGLVYKLDDVTQKYKKVFLIRENWYSILCPDGSLPMLYESEDHLIYFIGLKRYVNISSHIQSAREIITSESHPCG